MHNAGSDPGIRPVAGRALGRPIDQHMGTTTPEPTWSCRCCPLLRHLDRLKVDPALEPAPSPCSVVILRRIDQLAVDQTRLAHAAPSQMILRTEEGLVTTAWTTSTSGSKRAGW